MHVVIDISQDLYSIKLHHAIHFTIGEAAWSTSYYMITSSN